MKSIGLICEYNPFHNGHLYHITKTKEMFPDSIIILVLNGYFLERGEISLLTKEDKTKLALQYGIDLVVALPVVFGVQSADIFAEKAIEILNHLQVNDIVFGSECNDIELLKKIAEEQRSEEYQNRVKNSLKKGINYPTALSSSSKYSKINTPNDLLGISYIKTVMNRQLPIKLHTILRTNDYHDTNGEDGILSASNLRAKLKENKDISSYVPKEVINYIHSLDENLFWNILKHTIITYPHLEEFLTVDEGIETHLKKIILETNNYDDFITKAKTKRYTYNKISRMLIHIFLGLTKKDNENFTLDYIQALGFNQKGQQYLNNIRKNSTIAFQPNYTSPLFAYEKKAALLYDFLMQTNTYDFENKKQPIIFTDNEKK